MSRASFVIVSLVLLFSVLAIGTPAQQTNQAPSSSSDCAELPALKRRLTGAESRLKDWPALGRYREANAGIKPPQSGEDRVVFMGDSITDLWSKEEFGGFFPGKPYINRGISGQTTPQMLVRFRPDVIALQPKVVVILAGTNDIAGNTGPTTLEAIEDNLASMAELANAHGIRVVFASVLPVSDYNRSKDGKQIVRTVDRPPAKILELNAWLKQYATSNKHTYLDYYSAVVDDKGMLKAELAGDGLHPNARGYAIMGPLAERAIKQAMSGRR